MPKPFSRRYDSRGIDPDSRTQKGGLILHLSGRQATQ